MLYLLCVLAASTGPPSWAKSLSTTTAATDRKKGRKEIEKLYDGNIERIIRLYEARGVQTIERNILTRYIPCVLFEKYYLYLQYACVDEAN